MIIRQVWLMFSKHILVGSSRKNVKITNLLLPHLLISSWQGRNQGILKGEVSLNCWPPVWLVWNQLYDNWQFFVLFEKQTNPKPVKQKVNITVILPLLAFPGEMLQLILINNLTSGDRWCPSSRKSWSSAAASARFHPGCRTRPEAALLAGAR